jgi:hypothetical protein
VRSVLLGVSGTIPTNNQTYYGAIGQIGDATDANFASSAQESHVQQVMPMAGTITRFAVRSSQAPGGSASWTYRIRKNGADTAAFVTIAGSATSGEISEPITVAAGDLLSMSLVPSTSPASTGTRRWTVEFESDDGTTPIFFRVALAAATFPGGIFPISGQGASSAMDGTQGNIMPCAGVIKSFRARCGVVPGGSNGWLVTLQVNGTPTALAATITSAATSVISAEANIAVAAGDIVRWNITKVSAPANENTFSVTASFEPTVAGDQPIMGVSFTNFLSQSQTEYAYPLGVRAWLTEDEAGAQALLFERTIKNFWAKLTVAPGSTHTRAISLRIGGSSVYTLVLSSAAVVSNLNEAAAADLSLFAIQHDPTGTPANSFLSWSTTLFIASSPSDESDTGIPIGYWFPSR